MAVTLLCPSMLTTMDRSDTLARDGLIRGIERGEIAIDPDVDALQTEDGAEHYIIRLADLDRQYQYIVEVSSVQVGPEAGFQFNRLYMDGFRLGGDTFGLPVVRAICEHTNLFGGCDNEGPHRDHQGQAIRWR